MAHGCTYCTDDFHCEKYTDEKYTSWCYGKDYPCKDRRISNADRIRAMTNEELADFLDRWEMGDIDYSKTFCDLCVGQYDCHDDCLLDWLRQEATDG